MLLGVGGYFAGAFGGAGYSRTVGRLQAQVMRALSDLDVTAQPGAPGSTAEASGGVKPEFRLENRRRSHDLVCDERQTRRHQNDRDLHADRPRKRSRVVASVERGDAPDDFVPPAFRSKGLTTMRLSAMEAELRRAGCPTDNGGVFKLVGSHMGPAAP
jgi:hypothetical protein